MSKRQIVKIPAEVSQMPDPDEGLRELNSQPSTMEMIDEAMFLYVKDLNLHVASNEGFREVPVVWGSSELAYQVKHDQSLRDVSGSLRYPIISVERTSVTKDLGRKGNVFGAIPEVFGPQGGAVPVARRIVTDKTGFFENAQAKRKKNNYNWAFRREQPPPKTITETVYMPIPVYLSIKYVIGIRAEYEQHMNEILTYFLSKPGGVNYLLLPTKYNHRYEAFVGSEFPREGTTGAPGEEERYFETKFEIEVLGYIQGEGKNRDKSDTSTYENFVDIRTPRSNAMYDADAALSGSLPGID